MRFHIHRSWSTLIPADCGAQVNAFHSGGHFPLSSEHIVFVVARLRFGRVDKALNRVDCCKFYLFLVVFFCLVYWFVIVVALRVGWNA